MGQKVTLKIDHEGEFTVNSSDIDNPDRNSNIANQQLLNVLLKQAMGQTGLLQFGNRPRFFDASNPIKVPELDMQIWGGFKAIAYKYQDGCNIVIDSCARFMSTKSVLDRIYEIRDEMDNNSRHGPPSTAEFQDQVRRQLVG
jgi:hypothetical protein